MKVVFGPQNELLDTPESKTEREVHELTRDIEKLEREKRFFTPDEFRRRMGKLRIRMAVLAENGAVKLPTMWYVRHADELREGLKDFKAGTPTG